MARANVLCVCIGSSASQDPRTTVLILDTCASFGSKPFKIDFIDYVKCNIRVKNVSKVNTVISIGTTIHSFVDANGKYVFLTCVFIFSQPRMCNFSPQIYHQLHDAKSIIKVFNVRMLLKNNKIVIPINIQEYNLPIIYNSYVTSSQKKRHGPILMDISQFPLQIELAHTATYIG